MKLKSRLVDPPGQWRYTQPETGHKMKHVTFNMLVFLVAQHRANMKIVTKGDLASEVEEAICASLSPANQIAHCEDGQAHPKSVHWTQVERFFKTAAAYVGGEDSLVSPEEAGRRAAICATCPLNVTTHGCAMCKQALNGLREEFTTRRTEHDEDLRACSVCGCDNRLAVHVPLAALRAGSGDLPYPSGWCWRAQSGPNVKPA